LGLFGGTFDPPHFGHLLVAQEVADALDLARVLFIPARLPPHKVAETLTPAGLRMEMVREAIRGNQRFEASDLELGREGPSFTVDTLRYFREQADVGELFFIMGSDQVKEFHTWQDPEIVAELATLVAMTREGAGSDPASPVVLPSGVSVEFVRVPVTRIDLSSTDVRARVRTGHSIRYLVPDGVRRIIENRELYRLSS